MTSSDALSLFDLPNEVCVQGIDDARNLGH